MQRLRSLLTHLRQCCESFPDPRRGQNATYSIADIGIAAFAVFFMQSPSFLAAQQRLRETHARSNAETLFGLTRIPSDNHIRSMLDPAAPSLLNPAFTAALDELEQSGNLGAFRQLGQHVAIALDGTEYFCSNKLHCAQCSKRQRSNGTTEYFHTMLSATVVAPGHNHVLPLQPEFVTPQDGAAKQDCESRAARRWLAAHGPHHARLNPIYLGDDLFSNQPMCQAVLASGGHFLFVAKPISHPLIQEYLAGIEVPSLTVPVKRGHQRFTHRLRWLTEVPLRDGKDALTVNWLEIEIHDAAGKLTYRNSFITDLPVGRDNVAELAACGRARWKIENNTFNVLKTTGYHLEHNFGHGRQNLAALLAALNLLAFAFHTVCDQAIQLWQLARVKAGSRAQFFSHLAAITSFLVFPSWEDLMQTLAFAKPPPRPP
ncbi:MAG TPA: ISNCY family transposase, partial [Gammaproteobacteria bacterium]|nr:ISNCY family transposase [Gammaproteobacteria bacterium]